MTRLYTLLILCVFLFNATNESRADEEFNPVSVTDGALLFFFHPESAEGNPESGLNDRVDVLYVFDPGLHQKPCRIWQGTDPPFARPIALLDTGIVVFEQGDKSFLLDLKSGETTDLLPTKNQLEVISVEKGKVYFVDRQNRNAPFPYGGMKLQTGKNDQTIVKEYFRPRDILYVLDRSKSDHAKKLVDLQVEAILFEDDKGFWVITSGVRGNDRKLCKISKTGDFEEVVPFPNEWMASLTRVKFSPNNKYLALSSAHEKHDFHNERELIVIDLEKKEVVYSKSKIQPNLPLFGGAPHILLAWSNDDLLYFGNHALDIKTGKDPSEERLKQAEIVTTSPYLDKNTIGFFDIRHGEAYFKGDEEPVASVLDKLGTQVMDLSVDERGDWVVFASTDYKNTYIVNGKTQEKRVLISGWSYELKWIAMQTSLYR